MHVQNFLNNLDPTILVNVLEHCVLLLNPRNSATLQINSVVSTEIESWKPANHTHRADYTSLFSTCLSYRGQSLSKNRNNVSLNRLADSRNIGCGNHNSYCGVHSATHNITSYLPGRLPSPLSSPWANDKALSDKVHIFKQNWMSFSAHLGHFE